MSLSKPKNSVFITTPIYYVNDSPHIGHAYTSLACDVLARFKRLDGHHVKFLTGTDEHGQKVEISAGKAEKDPQQFTDEVSQRFRDLAKLLNLSNDDFIRTTEKRHITSAQAMWKRLVDNGHITLGSYAGWYSVRDETYYTESDLVDGKAPTGAPVEWVEEPSYFFDLSKWQDKLLAHYEAHPDFIMPESRRNEIISFVKGGLKDLSVSRTSFRWGIPIPGDKKHVMYVWLDALVNYLSALGFPDIESEDFIEFWLREKTDIIHIVGKDIVRFHAVYWPAFLMAADLPLPKHVVAHGWWTNEGQKISKSLGNVIDPVALVNEFGLDQTRYFLMREVPFGNDGNFSRNAMIHRINAELANNIGNLVQRTLSMISKNCNAAVPDLTGLPELAKVKGESSLLDSAITVATEIGDKLLHEGIVSAAKYISSFADKMNEKMAEKAHEMVGEVTKERTSLSQEERNAIPLLAACDGAIVTIRGLMEQRNFSGVLEVIIDLANQSNSYIDHTAPWTLKKTDPAQMNLVLYVLAEAIRTIGILLQPFMPDAAAKILDQLAISSKKRSFAHLSEAYSLTSGSKLPEPQGVFPRYVEIEPVVIPDSSVKGEAKGKNKKDKSNAS